MALGGKLGLLFTPSHPKAPLLHPLGLVSPISSLGAWGRLFPLEPPRGLQDSSSTTEAALARFSTVLFLRRFSFATCHPVSLCDPPFLCSQQMTPLPQDAGATSPCPCRSSPPLPLNTPTPPLPFADCRASAGLPLVAGSELPRGLGHSEAPQRPL